MPFIKGWQDPITGMSLGAAYFVVSQVATDTRLRQATVLVDVYVGLSQYSAGCQPCGSQNQYVVVGSAYIAGLENNLRARAQTYISGLAEYSGAQVV